MAKSKKRRRKNNLKKGNNVKAELKDIFLRYLILVIVALPGLALFYTIFRPLTVYPVYWILNLFYEADLISSTIIILEGFLPIELVPACIAGAAYYLLLILNLTTPGINANKRIRMIVIAFLAFLTVNILRIFVLSIMALNGSSFFDITHEIFWYSVSTIFVVAIWFVQVSLFKIKEIPLYLDIKFLFRHTKK